MVVFQDMLEHCSERSKCYDKVLISPTCRQVDANMNTWCNPRDREEQGENSWGGCREDGDEGVKCRVPESQGATMCLAFVKGQLWIISVLTVEMIAVGGEEGSHG
jgi:hypothetical protein